ncbi:response regulator transcription factor [Pelagicoccus mobilis]|uniref:Response regulator transcription factor n=1 Tax=Pelagicoccus mobilis TaxID=415221 RepID=A0A934VPV0_9BACT|nr:response regulator transcription factor [Pelagicoccus mobilis]MBK1876200.1 response regulator transcription factor [Pelagicoccus mobilis]
MNSIDVWIVEDDADYRRMLTRVLDRSPQIASCRDFPSCISFLDAIKTEKHPHAVLMDLGLPRMSGITGIKELSQNAPDIAVIVLTVFGEKEKVLEALEAGASGYLLKTATTAEIRKGIQDAVWGGTPLSASVARFVLEEYRKPALANDFKLAAREIEVLHKLSLGHSVKEISSSLEISQATVSTYLRRIYSKLDVQSQSGAVAKALRSGIIE